MGAGARRNALHLRRVLRREDHAHPRRSGPDRFQGREHRHVADWKLLYPEQIRSLPESGRWTVEPGSRRPKSIAQERVDVDYRFQGVREGPEPDTGSSGFVERV